MSKLKRKQESLAGSCSSQTGLFHWLLEIAFVLNNVYLGKKTDKVQTVKKYIIPGPIFYKYNSLKGFVQA